MEHHLQNATSKPPQNYSRFVWVTGDDAARNRVLRKLIPNGQEGDSVLDDVAGIGHIRRLVWLQALDMTALPRSTNLYMAMIVRLEDALVRRGSQVTVARSRLERLTLAKRSLAIGFPGNVRDRAGHLDPENYAFEVQESAMAQVMGPQRVEEAIGEVAEEIRSSHGIDPLFIYPIINLEFGLERLSEIFLSSKILRSPRLIFVLTSDATVVEVARRFTDVDRFIPSAQIINVES